MRGHDCLCLWLCVSHQTTPRLSSFNVTSSVVDVEKSYPLSVSQRKMYDIRYCLPSSSQILVTLISVICFCSTKLDLRFSLALCDKEKQFRQTRRERVMLGIKKLLDMEKPRFLPSSPEEVGTEQLNEGSA